MIEATDRVRPGGPGRAFFFAKIYEVVRRIPPGKVATYGQIARLLGMPHGARTVGWALRAAPEGSDLPWQRVVGGRGTISLATDQGAGLQRALLEEEGVDFDDRGRVDLSKYGWAGLDLAERDELAR